MQNYRSKSYNTEYSSSKTFDAGLRSYMQRVYNLMSLALFITAITAFITANVPAIFHTIHGSPLKWLVMFAPLAFVFFFSAKINSISANTAKNYLWIFSLLMGLSLSYIFVIYSAQSIARVFFITSIMFGSMSYYGYVTKKDLSSWGSFLIMGVIGIIIASIINIFLQSSAMDFAISFIGVIIFTALTAYDTQKIKNLYYQLSNSDSSSIQKSAIMGALSLYMDFINLFIMLLRFFGERK